MPRPRLRAAVSSRFGQQRRGVRRLLRRQRVGQPHGVPQHVVRRQPERIERRLAHERKVDDLHETGARERAADPAPQSLGARQPASRGRRRQDRRHRVVPDDPGHLLDQVVGVVEIRSPPRRDGRQAGVALVERAAHRLQRGHGRGGVDRHARHPRGQVVGQVDRGRGGWRPDDGHPGLDRAAAVGREQLGRAVGRRLADGGVDAALVALAGLGGELVPLAGAEHRHGVPVRRLDEDPGGGPGHLRRLATHHTAEADQAGVVGDDEVLGGQGAVGAVQGDQVLALLRPSDPDRARQLVGVVTVEGTADLEHDVVGDVDCQGDRAHPGELDPACHPVRRGSSGVEAGHGAGHEDRAPGRVVDDDRVPVAGGRRDVPERRVAEGGVVGQRRFPGDPAERQGVGPVRVDLELDDLLAEAEEVEGVRTRLAGIRGQHDDPVVVLAEPELLGRTDHPGRHMAVGLACGDLEATRQDTSGQHHDDEVAGREVVGTADDPLGFAGAVRATDVDGAPVDGLAVLLGFRLHRQDPTHHQRTGDVVARFLDRLELEPEGRQPGSQVLGGDVAGQVDVVADPGDRGLHRVTVPFRRPRRSGRRPRRSHAGR